MDDTMIKRIIGGIICIVAWICVTVGAVIVSKDLAIAYILCAVMTGIYFIEV